MPASVYTKPMRCRLKRAYANAYATYVVCMGASAWGIICLVEFPLYLLFCIQKKKNTTQMGINSKFLGPLISQVLVDTFWWTLKVFVHHTTVSQKKMMNGLAGEVDHQSQHALSTLDNSNWWDLNGFWLTLHLSWLVQQLPSRIPFLARGFNPSKTYQAYIDPADHHSCMKCKTNWLVNLNLAGQISQYSMLTMVIKSSIIRIIHFFVVLC